MVERIHPNITGMELSGTDPKGKRRHLVDRTNIFSLEGGVGSDRHLD